MKPITKIDRQYWHKATYTVGALLVMFSLCISNAHAYVQSHDLDHELLSGVYQASEINGFHLPYDIDPDLIDIQCDNPDVQLLTSIASVQQLFFVDGHTSISIEADLSCGLDSSKIISSSNSIHGSFSIDEKGLSVKFEEKEIVVSNVEFMSGAIKLRLSDPVLKDITLDLIMIKAERIL